METDKVCEGVWGLDRITASASVKDGVVTITAANVSDAEAANVEVRVPNTGKVSARVLSGEPAQYNDFDHSPLCVREFTDFTVDDDFITLSMPACSVVELTVE